MERAKLRNLPWWKVLLYTLGGNSLIAAVLWLAGRYGTFGEIWVTAQCIGLSTCYAHLLIECLLGERGEHWFFTAVAIVLGLLVGVLAARQLGVTKASEVFFSDWRNTLRFLGLGAVFTLAFIWFFRSRERIHELDQARRAAELREVSGQKAALAARLRLLQAQIEPHFLFNTLANLHSLIGRDDSAARTLLERLDEYLRASLVHSRAEDTSLGDECRLLEVYLGIQAQRMGGRLAWEIAVPEALRRLAFPPMLLQPLVENAIRHGVEPKLGPARIEVVAREENGQLVLTVRDNGVGLTGNSHGAGVGLANVRERLATLFGSAARLDLVETPPAGLTAQLWIPRDTTAP